MLVFVQSIERAKELFHELIYDGINVEVMHAERTQAQRDNIVKAFRAGKASTLWGLFHLLRVCQRRGKGRGKGGQWAGQGEGQGEGQEEGQGEGQGGVCTEPT